MYGKYIYIFISSFLYMHRTCEEFSLMTTAGSKRAHGSHLRWDHQTWLGENGLVLRMVFDVALNMSSIFVGILGRFPPKKLKTLRPTTV